MKKITRGSALAFHNRGDLFQINVFIYNLLLTSIPSGSDSQIIGDQFKQAIGDIYSLQSRNVYKNAAEVTGREIFLIGSMPFLDTRLTCSLQDNIKLVSHLYLAGYKGYFLKIRATYHERSSVESERKLLYFLRMLGEQLK